METVIGSYFWSVAFACIGGVIIFVGLLMEVFGEKRWYKNARSFRRWESIKHWGEWFVIFGILVEVVVAYLSARDAWQTWQLAVKNSPLNQPITDISAQVFVKIKGTNFIEGNASSSTITVRGSLMNLGGDGTATFHPLINPGSTFAVTNIGGGMAMIVDGQIINYLGHGGFSTSQFGVLEAQGFNRYLFVRQNSHGYSIDFHLKRDDWIADNEVFRVRRPTVWEVMTNDLWVKIWCFFIPKDSEVVGGSVKLLFNGGIEKRLDIIPKSVEDASQKDKFGIGLIATNLNIKTVFSNSVVIPIQPGTTMMTNYRIPAEILYSH